MHDFFFSHFPCFPEPVENLTQVILFILSCSGSNIIVFFLTSENEIAGIIYSLFRGRQNTFLTVFSTKCVLKYATKNLKIG